MHRLAGCSLVACVCQMLLPFSPLWAQESQLTRALAPLYHSNHHYVGSYSCAAVACHQGPRPGVAVAESQRGSEFGLWAENDPHARAHDTLSSDESAGMLARLGIVRDGRIQKQAEYDNCLRCHGVEPSPAQRPENWNAAEAVSCEACHGPAEKWLVSHAQNDWQRDQAAELGMIDTQDLLVRARMCADCHVGSENREVNHDLIAAGHPALRFEMSADHGRLPKHWRDPEDDHPEFEWSLWLAGQIASADASLALTHARLSSKAPYKVWPEFAEYNCGDCHHALDVPTARERAEYRAQSVPRWGDWHHSYLPSIVGQPEPWADLRQRMIAGFAESNDGLIKQVHEVHSQLDRWVTEHGSSMFGEVERQQTVERVNALLQVQAEQGAASWEEAAQIYLVLRARDAARLRAEAAPQPRLDALLRMRETLRFDDAREFRLFFSAPGAENAIPYDEFHRELKHYVLSQ